MAQRIACLIIAAFCLCARAPAQQNRPQYLVEVDERLVRVHAVVFDRSGKLATGLTRDDFRVLDDGISQRIVKFSNNLREPVSIVLDADVSESMKQKLSFVREALDDLLEPFPDPQKQARFTDEFSLVRFATRAEIETPFLTPDSLKSHIDSLIQPTKGSTALFDSIYLAVNQIASDAANERQAIILITDGGDNHSRYTLRETKKFLEEANVPVFAVMVSPGLQLLDFVSPLRGLTTKKSLRLPSDLSAEDKPVIGPAERRGPSNLKSLAEDTGGDVFSVRHIDELPDVVRAIAVALRYSYVIGYEMPPAESTHPHNWNRRHKVELSLIPPAKYKGYLLDAKHSYYEGLQ